MPGVVNPPLAEENLGLVHHCANRFRGRGIEYEELYSAGCVGLLKAVKAFDRERGVQFSTYAVPVILGEIKRLFRDGGTVKVSRGLQECARKLQQHRERFQQQYGREPTLTELCKETGIAQEDAAQALCVTQPVLSLTSGGEDEAPLEIPVEAPDEEISDILALRQLMAALDPKDRMLLNCVIFII